MFGALVSRSLCLKTRLHSIASVFQIRANTSGARAWKLNPFAEVKHHGCRRRGWRCTAGVMFELVRRTEDSIGTVACAGEPHIWFESSIAIRCDRCFVKLLMETLFRRCQKKKAFIIRRWQDIDSELLGPQDYQQQRHITFSCRSQAESCEKQKNQVYRHKYLTRKASRDKENVTEGMRAEFCTDLCIFGAVLESPKQGKIVCIIRLGSELWFAVCVRACSNQPWCGVRKRCRPEVSWTQDTSENWWLYHFRRKLFVGKTLLEHRRFREYDISEARL